MSRSLAVAIGVLLLLLSLTIHGLLNNPTHARTDSTNRAGAASQPVHSDGRLDADFTAMQGPQLSPLSTGGTIDSCTFEIAQSRLVSNPAVFENPSSSSTKIRILRI